MVKIVNIILISACMLSCISYGAEARNVPSTNLDAIDDFALLSTPNIRNVQESELYAAISSGKFKLFIATKGHNLQDVKKSLADYKRDGLKMHKVEQQLMQSQKDTPKDLKKLISHLHKARNDHQQAYKSALKHKQGALALDALNFVLLKLNDAQQRQSLLAAEIEQLAIKNDALQKEQEVIKAEMKKL